MLWRLANQSLLAHLLVELHRANYHAPELNAAVRVTTWGVHPVASEQADGEQARAVA